MLPVKSRERSRERNRERSRERNKEKKDGTAWTASANSHAPRGECEPWGAGEDFA
jgi:hypothetical protein